MKRILIIEDNAEQQRAFFLRLSRHFDLVQAFSIIEPGISNLLESKYDLIAIDGCVPGDNFNTGPLIARIRQSHDCPLVAISSSHELRLKMRELGCTHECEKTELARQIVMILGRPAMSA